MPNPRRSMKKRSKNLFQNRIETGVFAAWDRFVLPVLCHVAQE